MAVTAANAVILGSNTYYMAAETSDVTRFCGRYFATAIAAFVSGEPSVCSKL